MEVITKVLRQQENNLLLKDSLIKFVKETIRASTNSFKMTARISSIPSEYLFFILKIQVLTSNEREIKTLIHQ